MKMSMIKHSKNKNKSPIWSIGLMSGTSFDGVDASLILTNGEEIFEYAGNFYLPYENSLTQTLREICNSKNNYNLSKILLVEKQLTHFHIQAVNSLIEKVNVPKAEISLIGFHGQTIFHDPENMQTCQIGDAALLAKSAHINVISNFRQMDILNGGKGAPLAPLYHEALLKNFPKPASIINLGGISNITYLTPKPSKNTAFDIGPGSCLINDFVQQHFGIPFDKNGKIAASGQIHEALIENWLAHPYFSIKGSKSLDRSDFSYITYDHSISKKDFVATLTRFTSKAIYNAIKDLQGKTPGICFLSGGGRKNHLIASQIKQDLRQLNIFTKFIDEIDSRLDGDFIESDAFAFLAVRSLYGMPTSKPAFTGSKESSIGGDLFKATS